MQYRLLASWGEAGGLIMRRTFLDVCLCGTRISQIPIPTARRMATKRLRCTLCISLSCIRILIYVLAWANWRCLSCVGWTMREPVFPGWAEEQIPTLFLYHHILRIFAWLGVFAGYIFDAYG